MEDIKGGRGERLILLYSGGLDSAYVYKTLLEDGVDVIPLHALVSRRILAVAVRNLRRISPRKPVTLYVSNHSEILSVIARRLRAIGASSYTCIVCKALMLIEASKLADEIGADGIVTGETLGQVASQTLPNMLIVHRFSSRPVYTPLLALDKHEAGNLLASLLEKTPQCPFLPRRPVTRPDPVEALLVMREVGVDASIARLVRFERLIV